MTDEKKRPKPEYGEYAPEGWVSPVTGEPVVPSEPESNASENTAPAASARSSAKSATPASSAKHSRGHLDGVPHNLGVNKAAAPKAETSKIVATNTASAGTTDETSTEAFASSPASPRQNSDAARMNRPVDRIATVMLLAFGAYGALNMASAFMNLQQLFAQIYAVYDLGSFTAPEWFGALSTIGWMVSLAVWAIALIMSVQFMRRGRIAFYIPLAGAILAFVLATVLMTIAISAAPDLVTYVSEHGFDLKDFQ